MGKGYTRAEIEDSLKNMKYDDITATYLLLGRRSPDVSIGPLIIFRVEVAAAPINAALEKE